MGTVERRGIAFGLPSPGVFCLYMAAWRHFLPRFDPRGVTLIEIVALHSPYSPRHRRCRGIGPVVPPREVATYDEVSPEGAPMAQNPNHTRGSCGAMLLLFLEIASGQELPYWRFWKKPGAFVSRDIVSISECPSGRM